MDPKKTWQQVAAKATVNNLVKPRPGGGYSLTEFARTTIEREMKARGISPEDAQRMAPEEFVAALGLGDRAQLAAQKQVMLETMRPGKNLTVAKFMSTGRNDPCPCGSGKKFKRCCLE